MPDIQSASCNENLLTIAKKISKEYISSVLLVDDHISYASQETPDGTIDAGTFIDDLAKENISVCPYLWSREEQLANVINLIKTNDVSILDWKIQLQNRCPKEALDSDVMDDGDRGKNTQKLIDAIVRQRVPSPHLFIIYTEEPTGVQEYLSGLKWACDGSELQEKGHVWISPEKNIRISIFFKKSLSGTHGIDDSRVIQNSEQMISVVISEFARLHKGILPLTLIHSLTILRQSASKLLTVFNENLDPAFVLHRALLPEPADGDTLLMQTFLDAFSALFFYQNRRKFNLDDLTLAWLDEQSAQFAKESIDVDVTIELNNGEGKEKRKKKLVIGNDGRKELISKGYFSYFKDKILKEFVDEEHKQENAICDAAEEWINLHDIYGEIFKTVWQLFLLRDSGRMNMANEDFAILTHHKSVFYPDNGYLPVMMPGSVIKKADQNDKYFLCIQQACDCLRIADSRKFIFLPLDKSSCKFDIILKKPTDGQRQTLTVNHKKSYSLCTFTFKTQPEANVIKASADPAGRFVFTDVNSQSFFWCCDLKETFTLKFINEYAQKLTRVGIDQSEWLRRS